MHIDVNFKTCDQWQEFVEANNKLFNERIKAAVESIRERGLTDPYAGKFNPSDIVFGEDNLREALVAQGTNSRNRAVLYALQAFAGGKEGQIDLYGSEAVSPFAGRMREIFKRYVGSEYLPDDHDKENHPNVRHEDILDFTFENSRFDAYVSCEVLEHVVDIDQALREAARILKPGGVFVGTCPFHMGSRTRIVRATLEDGEVKHRMPPEYHGNPARPEEGSLVFAVPGWDLVSDMETAGFSDASMRFICSEELGILTNDVAGVFLFYAVK